MGSWWAGIAALLLMSGACGSPREAAPTTPPAVPVIAARDPEPVAIPAEPQRPGDPIAGRRALLDRGYVGCGVPRRIYDRFFGSAPAWSRIPDRGGPGDALPYWANTYTAPSGVELVTANCLACHAGFLRGQLVIGLGDSAGDFTMDVAGPMKLAGLLLRGDEKAEWDRLASRVSAIAPYIRTRTVGANPADTIAAVLFAHRDPKTLAWSDEPRIPLPPPAPPVPVDVPAWWLMKKQTAMFWTGAGRGDHARIMMTASVLCVDDVATARTVDAYFPDIRAFISSLEPPRYPGAIDARLAARGRDVFDTTCSGCHGTYGEGGHYPDKIVPLALVGTDPALTRGVGQFAGPYVDWFNHSFYGKVARLEPGDGYLAPPLDGVWATAPYLHNGSVPTLAALLDSSLRAKRWIRRRGANDYDLEAVGWRTEPAGDGAPSDPRWLFDTAERGYSNVGHTFGDELEPDERRAVLEYLKTL